MITAKKYNAAGEVSGEINLPEELFNVSCPNPNALLYEVVKMYLANQRQGNASTLTRGEMSGSTRKLYRQKGTGNARPGDARTPVRVGGGRAHGPKPKSWYRPIPRQKRRVALLLALSQRAAKGQVIILEDLAFTQPSTKLAKTLLDKVTPAGARRLVVIPDSNGTVIKSFANLPRVEMDRADALFAYEVLKNSWLVLTESALKKVQEVFAS